jgi:lipoprotein NlpI
MQALLSGQDQAIQLFRASVATDISEFVEYQVALTELKRLGL